MRLKKIYLLVAKHAAQQHQKCPRRLLCEQAGYMDLAITLVDRTGDVYLYQRELVRDVERGLIDFL